MRASCNLSAALTLLFVAGCGGEDSASSPTPTPTPTPTPVVTPTPTPTPSPTYYPSASDFSKAAFGQSPIAEVTYTEVYDPAAVLPAPYYKYKAASSQLLDSPGAGVFAWDPEKKIATARIGDYFHSFDSVSISERAPSGSFLEANYNVEGDQHTLRWSGVKDTPFAVVDLEVRPPCTFPPGEPKTCLTTTRYATIGGKTLPGELPQTGSRSVAVTTTFTLARPESPYTVYSNASAQLSIDFAARTAIAQWEIDGQEFILQGQYRPDHHTHLTGTVRSLDGRYNGTFAGNFYGAEAKIVAIVFSAQGDGRGVAGRIVGQTQ